MADVTAAAPKFTTKQIAITAVIILIVIAAIAFYFYRKGKKTVTIAKPPLDNPNANGNNSAGVSPGEIESIATDLHSDMDGFNWAGHDVAPYQKFDGLSDTDFVNVYNAFNTKYQVASGQTLLQWINSEDYAFNDVVESIVTRMGRLNLI